MIESMYRSSCPSKIAYIYVTEQEPHLNAKKKSIVSFKPATNVSTSSVVL